MSEELDRRVAIEIMGEEEPPKQTVVFKHYGEAVVPEYRSENWISVRKYEHRYEPKWEPKAFSSSTDEALRAVDKYFADAEEVNLHMGRRRSSEGISCWAYATAGYGDGVVIQDPAGLGDALPEAICQHLLALKEAK